MYNNHLDGYQERLKQLEAIANTQRDKSTLIFHAIRGDIVDAPLNKYIEDVITRKNEPDMKMIALVRMLYLTDGRVESVRLAKNRIIEAFSEFPFWPVDGNNSDMNSLCFWSENHLLMTLGSCYLFRQYMAHINSYTTTNAENDSSSNNNDSGNHDHKQQPSYVTSVETKLLQLYLKAHCTEEFDGVYEVNAHVYLPYTISALLNLVEFANDSDMKEHAMRILNNAVKQVMMTTTTNNGVCNLAGMCT